MRKPSVVLNTVFGAGDVPSRRNIQGDGGWYLPLHMNTTTPQHTTNAGSHTRLQNKPTCVHTTRSAREPKSYGARMPGEWYHVHKISHDERTTSNEEPTLFPRAAIAAVLVLPRLLLPCFCHAAAVLLLLCWRVMSHHGQRAAGPKCGGFRAEKCSLSAGPVTGKIAAVRHQRRRGCALATTCTGKGRYLPLYMNTTTHNTRRTPLAIHRIARVHTCPGAPMRRLFFF